MTHILMVVTSTSRLGESGTPTGAWLEELAAPFNAFKNEGYEITLASPLGGAAPIDPLSLEDPWLTPEGKHFMADSAAQVALSATLPLADVDAEAFDGIFLVGGAGTAWDFPDSEPLTALTSAIYQAGRPLAALCHGVLGLTNTQDAEGRHVIEGRSVTGVSNNEERATGYDAIVPILPEDRLQSLGGRYSCAKAFHAHVVEDGQILTGQNPASAAPLARCMIRALSG